ncbi:hypothetical protein Vretifemale_9078, partial [Volvox reticuliferus]
MEKTQGILEGCCVHLWQRVDGDGLSLEGITAKVKELGGKIATKLTKEVTHIIFQRALGTSVKELLAEDEDLRFIYRKIERSGGRLLVVSPLWLRSCETAKARAKEARFIVPQPKKPIFLDHIERGENKRKRRKSNSTRPREQVEVPDFDDALFSSSQQIRDLNSHSDCRINCGGTNREDDAAAKQSGKMQPPRLRNAGPPSVPGDPFKASSGLRGVPVRQQHCSSNKRGMRQLSLNFLILPKKPRLSLAKVAEPSSVMLRPAAELEVQDTCAAAEAVAGAACNELKDELPDSTSRKPLLLTQAMEAPAKQQQSSKAAVLEVLPKTQPEFMLGRGPSPALPGAVVDHKGADLSRLAWAQRPDRLGTRRLGGESSAVMAASAAHEHVANPGMPPLASLENAPLASAALPRAQVLQVTDRDACTDRSGGSSRAAAAVAVVALAPVARAPEVNKEGEDPAAKAPNPDPGANAEPAATALPPGAGKSRRSSTRDGSRLLATTPLALGLIKSLGRLTPMTTPNGITPGGLVVPKLKLQGTTAPLAATSGLPSGPDIPSMARPVLDSSPELDRWNRATVKTAAKPGTDGFLSSIRAAGREPSGRPEKEASTADKHLGAAPTVPASTRRSARIRGPLPPTPPALVQMRPQGAPEGLNDTTARAAELGKTSSVSHPGLFGSFLGPASSRTPVLGNLVVAATSGKALLGKSGDELEEAVSAGDCDLIGIAEKEHGGDGGTAIYRRSQRRTRARPVEPLPLSPVLYGNTSRHVLECEAAAAPDPIPAPGQEQLSKAGEPVGVETCAGQGVAPITLAQPCTGRTPSSTLRRSARLVGLTPRTLILPDKGCVNEHDAVPVTGLSYRPTGSRSQRRQRQEPHDCVWLGFQPPLQQPNLNPGPPPSVRRLFSEVSSIQSLQDAPCAAAPLPEDRAGAANCTPATARKARQRKQVRNEEEADTQAQQQLGLVPASVQKPPRHHNAPMLTAPYDLAVAAPSPAFCTRSRTRTAAVTPGIAIATEQHRMLLEAPSPPHLAGGKLPEGNGEPGSNSVGAPLPHPHPEILQSVPGGNLSSSGRMTGAPVPSLGLEDVAPGVFKRQGTVARSRRHALDSGLACDAQALPGTVIKVGCTKLTSMAAPLEAAAEPPTCAAVQATCAAGDDARLDEPQLPPNGPAHLSHACAAVAAPMPAILGDAAARPDAEATRVIESQGPGRPQPVTVTPKGTRPAAAANLRVSASVRDRTASVQPLSPRTSLQKWQSELPADEINVAGKGSEDSDRTSKTRMRTRKRRIIQCIGAPSADGSVEGAQTDRGAAGAADFMTGAMPRAAIATATMAIDQWAAAAQPAAIACNALVSISRSRLRLRKQEVAGQAPMTHLDGETQGGSVGPQEVSASAAAVLPCSNQPAAMPRRKLSTPLPKTTDKAPELEPAAGALELGVGDRPEGVLSSCIEATAEPSGPSQHIRDSEEGKVAPTKACRALAKKRKLLSVRGQTSLTAPVNLQGDTSRSMVLPKTFTAATAMACGPVTNCVGEVGGSKLNRAAPSAAMPTVVAPPRKVNPEAPAAWLAPVLGQCLRGKDHPMRAGYRYLAYTQVGEEMKATIEKAVKKLGGARQCTPGYEDGHITHLVMGDASTRTLKVLLGIANGAIFVSPSWVEASLAAGEWVPEEQHLVQ